MELASEKGDKSASGTGSANSAQEDTHPPVHPLTGTLTVTSHRLWLSGLLAVLLNGCAGYQLGPTNGLHAGEHSIQVNPFGNHTTEPRLSATVTTSIRKQLQQDGTYRLDTGNEGNIVVNGTIVEYDRSSLSFQPRDILTPRDYRIRIVADVTARERNSGKVVLDRRVAGHTTVRIGADLNSAERQAIPLLAEDLARNVTALLVDGQW